MLTIYNKYIVLYLILWKNYEKVHYHSVV